MKRLLVVLIFLSLFIGSCKNTPSTQKQDSETSYTIEVFIAENFLNQGKWDSYFKNLEVNLHRFENSLLMAAALQEANPRPDLVIGLDNTSCGNLEIDSLFYNPQFDFPLQKGLQLDPSGCLIPYGFNYLAVIYKENQHFPTSFGELQNPDWYRNIIMPNAQTTTVGRGILWWSIALFNHGGYRHFWRSVADNIKITTTSLEQAYDMFLSGESKLILAYDTLPFYHNQLVGRRELGMTIPAEGSYKIIKFAAISKDCAYKKQAEQILKQILSLEFQQNTIPQMFMHPARSDVNYEIDEKYIELPPKDVTMQLPLKIINYNQKIYLSRWQEIIEQ
ncbi:MAG: thiamine transport system substrate-binding protein [Candidatus Cloacimonadota bacterium]|jgi:thiamine transport system substrate-binding protein|nr:thiamine transport system substrate-binding protein [Candidatus Cloacimonadota bacterium]